MKNFILFITTCGLLAACGNDNKTDSESSELNDIQVIKSDSTEVADELIEIKGNQYTEYYENKKTQVKFQGNQDENGRRHGKWLHFSENGEELSMTMYNHGQRHGHSIVKYPNGAIHYLGEYQNDQLVGVWKTYNTDGSLATTKDYGYPDK